MTALAAVVGPPLHTLLLSVSGILSAADHSKSSLDSNLSLPAAERQCRLLPSANLPSLPPRTGPGTTASPAMKTSKTKHSSRNANARIVSTVDRAGLTRIERPSWISMNIAFLSDGLYGLRLEINVSFLVSFIFFKERVILLTCLAGILPVL